MWINFDQSKKLVRSESRFIMSGWFYPFKPQYQQAYSPHCSPFISCVTCWENFIKHQDITGDHFHYSHDMYTLFDQVVMLFRKDKMFVTITIGA